MGRYMGIYTAFCLATTGRVWELRQAHPALEPNTPVCVRDRRLQPHVHLCEPRPSSTGKLLSILAPCRPLWGLHSKVLMGGWA